MGADLNYFEIPAENAERARGFWSSLFGWTFEPSPGDVPYFMAQGEGLGIGLYQSDERGLWPYFFVDDLETSLQQVEALGGAVRDKGPVPGVGWYGRCEDTEGNKFGIFQTDESAA